MIRGLNRKKSKVGVVIVSGSCCIPGMAPFDEAAQRIVEQAVSETGVAALVRVVPASNAMFGGVPMKVTAQLMSEANNGRMPIPAILINGEVVSYGVPSLEEMKKALLGSAEKTPIKEEQSNE
ncbi:MAG: hypothetical protein WC891_02700 [Actinomycetota bacterium]